MFRAPSNASHDAAIRLRRVRGAGVPPAKRPAGGSLLRLLHGLALAIVAMVAIGVASPGRSGGTFSAEAAASDGPNGSRWAVASEQVQRSHRWRDGAPRAVADFKAIEFDDDDADTLCDLLDDPTVAVKDPCFSRGSGRARRAHAQIDPSRFAAGTGLPRGPPV